MKLTEEDLLSVLLALMVSVVFCSMIFCSAVSL